MPGGTKKEKLKSPKLINEFLFKCYWFQKNEKPRLEPKWRTAVPSGLSAKRPKMNVNNNFKTQNTQTHDQQ